MSSSSSLSNAKILGGIGSILSLLLVVPRVGWILTIVGFVMILVAVKYIADSLMEKKIFSNMMVAVTFSIVGIVVGSLVVVGTVLRAFQNGYFASNFPFTPSTSVTMSQWATFGMEIGLGLFGAWIFFLVSAVFLRRSYSTIGRKLNVHIFNTAGLLYLVGAGTAIVGVGFLIILVAQILTVVAFFSIPEKTSEASQPQSVAIMH